MRNHVIFAFILLSLAGCGGKLPGSTPRSQVTPLFPAVSLSESHGDGKLAIFTVKLPLSESSISTVSSPIDPRSGVSQVPILGDVLRLVGQAAFNVATKFGVANQKIILSQPLPELDDEIIKHVSIKRVFFQIEQTEAQEEARRRRRNFIGRAFGGVRSLIRGKTRMDFDFINELKINMRMAHAGGEVSSWLPDVIFPDDHPERFESELRIAQADQEKPFTLMKYEKKNRKQVTNNATMGTIFTLYTDEAVAVQRVLRKHEEFAPLIKEMSKVGKSLIVELNGREKEKKEFELLMRKYQGELQEFKIRKNICDDETCMDLKVDQRNLLPMLMRGNTLKIDTTMKLEEVPPTSFQMRGFIEFEVRVDF